MTGLEKLRACGFTAIDIPLSRKKWATIDVEDAPIVLNKRYWAQPTGRIDRFYARRRNGTSSAYLHQDIVGDGPLDTDHRNGNTLDNRRNNLRKCTRLQNSVNERFIRPNNKSGFKGVHFDSEQKKWRALIWVNKKRIELGRFNDVLMAARAYDDAAIKYFGEFAATNETIGSQRRPRGI